MYSTAHKTVYSSRQSVKSSVLQLNNVMYTVFDSVMLLDKYNGFTEGPSFTSKRSVLVACYYLSLSLVLLMYVVQCTVHCSTLCSSGYTIELDATYQVQERGCSSVSKSDQPVSWTPRYSLLYNNVYSLAHRTAYSALYNHYRMHRHFIVQLTVQSHKFHWMTIIKSS